MVEFMIDHRKADKEEFHRIYVSIVSINGRLRKEEHCQFEI